MDEKMLQHLSKLCKIAFSDKEIETFQKDLHSIINHFDHLKEVETKGVQACSHVSKPTSNVTRKDDTLEHLSRAVFLANSPSHIAGMIRVPPVIHRVNDVS